MRKIGSFIKSVKIKIGHTIQILDIRGQWFRGNLNPDAPEATASKIPALGAKMEANGLRTPPGFGDNRNVTSAKSEISLSSMLPIGKMLGPKRPTPRKKSASTTHADDDSIPRQYKGGKKKDEDQ